MIDWPDTGLLDGDWIQPSLVDDAVLNQWDRRVWATADGTGDQGRGIIRCAICDGPLAEHDTFTHGRELGWR